MAISLSGPDVVAIFNPSAALAVAASRWLAALRGAGILLQEASSRVETTAIARAIARSGARLCVSCGGDGTANATAEGLLGTATALLPCPLGTGNDLASALGVPLEPGGFLERVSAGRAVSQDVIGVAGRVVLIGGGMGAAFSLSRRACEAPASIRRRWGRFFYLRAALSTLAGERREGIRVRLECDGQAWEGNAVGVAVQNHRRTGGIFYPAPAAIPDDGRMEVAVLPKRWGIAGDLLAGLRTLGPLAPGAPFILQGVRCRIECERKMTFYGDGDPIAEGTTFDVELFPAGLKVWLGPRGWRG